MPTPREGDIRVRFDQSGGVELVGTTNQVAAAMDRFGVSQQRANRESGALTRGLRDVNTRISSIDKTARIAATALGGLFVVQQIGRFVGAVGEASTAWTQYNNILKATTDTNAELATAQTAVFDLAQDLRQDLEPTAAVFQRLTRSTEELALTQPEVLRLQETITKLGIAGGKTGQEVSAGLLQMTQGLEAGRIQGEEFRSMAENLSPVLDAVAKSLGISRDELREMSKEGEFTARVLVEGLAESADTADEQFGKMEVTIPRAAEKFQNSMTRIIGKLDEMTGASRTAAGVLDTLADTLDKFGKLDTPEERLKRLGQEYLKVRQAIEIGIPLFTTHAERVELMSKETELLAAGWEFARAEAEKYRAEQDEHTKAIVNLYEAYGESRIRAKDLNEEIDELISRNPAGIFQATAAEIERSERAAARYNDKLEEMTRLLDVAGLRFAAQLETIKDVNAELDDLLSEDPEGVFGGSYENLQAQVDETADAFRRWADVFVRLDEDWSNLLSTLLAGMGEVIALANTVSPTLVDRLGAGATGLGIGQQIGLGLGGGRGTGLGALAGGLFGPRLLGQSLGSFAFPINPLVGTAVGAGVGGLIESLFGGGSPASPELAIGGSLSTTGQVAGTQRVTAFGGLGLRDPRGADPFTELGRIADLIANTDQRIAQFLSGSEISAVRGSRAGLEVVADSDSQQEINNAINQVFKDTLDAVSTTLGDIFDAETIGGAIDAGLGAEIAASLVELDDALSRLGLTLSQELVDAAGGAQQALVLVNDYINRYFKPHEIAEINLQRAQSVLDEQFGDMIEEFGITSENFREIFESAQPEGEDLVRWLELGAALGVVEDATEAYNAELERLNDNTEELTENTEDLADSAEDAAEAVAEIDRELQRFADSVSDALRRIGELRQQRSDLAGEFEGIDNATSLFNRARGNPISNFISDFDESLLNIQNWDGSIASLQDINREMENFQQAAAELAISIAESIDDIEQSARDAVFTIDRDLARIEGGSQGEYNFLRDTIADLSTRIEQSNDPTEIARLQARRNQLAREAWDLLDDEQKRIFGEEFKDFFTGTSDESVAILETMQENILTVADTLQEYGVSFLSIQDSVLPIPEIRDLIDSLPDDIADSVTTLLQSQNQLGLVDPVVLASLGNIPTAIDKMADKAIPAFEVSVNQFGNHVNRIRGAADVIELASRRSINVRVETTDAETN